MTCEKIWIGTWSMAGERYGKCTEIDAINTLKEAFNLGYHYFDTAEFYGRGRSENLLQKALGKHRKDIYISSKGGLQWEKNNVIYDGSPKALRKTLIQSLKRLQTDYLDLYSLHWQDPKTPLEVSLSALHTFQKEGLIRQWGVCNLSPESIQKLPYLTPAIPHQVHYNPIVQNMKLSLKAGQEKCHNIITSPFEHGLLLNPQKKLGKKDHRRKSSVFKDPKQKEQMQKYFEDCHSTQDRLQKILDHLHEKTYCNSILIGARKVTQLRNIHEIITNKRECA